MITRTFAALLVALLYVAPVHAEDNKVLHSLLAGSFILHGIDTSESMYMFGRYGDRFHEGNPVLRPFQNRPVAFGLVKMTFAATVNGILLSAHEQHPTLVKVALIVNNVAMTYVVVHNARAARSVGVK